jgi:hypothetical protein
MERSPVNSSQMKSLGYDARRKILEAEFATGAVYRYFNVPASVYRAMLDADSIGAYFNKHIREGYAYMKVD